MSHLEREVRRAQRRLWINRWLHALGWCLVFGIGLWIALWVPHRLFSLKWPMDIVALAILGASLAASFVWLSIRRENRLDAAAALDAAAGLRERSSTSVAMPGDGGDPFQAAVHRDAEQRITGLNARRFLPLRWSGSLSLSGMMLLVAALSLLIPELNLLGKDEDKAEAQANTQVDQAKVEALKRPVSIIEKVAQQNPDIDLDDMSRKVDPKELRRMNGDPGFKRRMAKKQLNTLRDALKNKATSEKFRAQREVNKRLRQIGQPDDPKSELRDLMSHMAAGEFGEAQEAVKKLQEKLAKRMRNGKMDPASAAKLKQQLNELAKKLKEAAEKQQAAQDRQAQQQLQNAGMTKEEAQRVLNDLAKKDPEQLKKMAQKLAQRLKDKGMTQQQMQKLLNKLQQQQKAQQQANKQCNKMGQCMKRAAKSMEAGNSKQAQQQLSQAGEQLSEMEQMEQTLNDLESQLDDLQNAESDLEDFKPFSDEKQCDMCGGTGFLPDGSPCPKCNKNGQGGGQNPGQGNRGRGFGKRARNDNVKTGTRDVRAKTRNGKGGSVIGRQFVKGSQERGESQVDFNDAFEAGEIDATDSLNRGRIPRKYKKSIRRYFDRIRGDIDAGKAPTESKDKPSAEAGDATGASDSSADSGGDMTDAGVKDDSAGDS